MAVELALRDLPEYTKQRVVVFIDGQNLYHTCAEVFHHPLCHPHLLSAQLAAGRRLVETRFYTGIHDPRKYPEYHGRVDRRLKAMQAHGATVVTRRLSYVPKWVPTRRLELPDPRASLGQVRAGELVAAEVGAEKGIDVAVALDLVRYAREGRFDVAVLVSRDRDLHGAVEEVHAIGREKREVLQVEVAFLTPLDRGPFATSPPFNRVNWITRPMFQECIDLTNYTVLPVRAEEAAVAAEEVESVVVSDEPGEAGAAQG